MEEEARSSPQAQEKKDEGSLVSVFESTYPIEVLSAN
jgi:hypothetical protein